MRAAAIAFTVITFAMFPGVIVAAVIFAGLVGLAAGYLIGRRRGREQAREEWLAWTASKLVGPPGMWQG